MAISDRVESAVKKFKEREEKFMLSRHKEFAEKMEKMGIIKSTGYNIVSPDKTTKEEAENAKFLIG